MSTEVWHDWSCTVRVVTSDPQVLAPAVRDTRALMSRVERCASRFRSDTELSRCTRRAGSMTPVSELFVELLGAAIEAAKFTEGAVDPTVGAHLVALGYDSDIRTVMETPRTTPVHAMPRRLPDWEAIRIDPELRLVGIPSGLALDFGATAKSWTADRAARDLHRRYGGRVLVEIGGDIAVAGAEQHPFVIKVAEREGEPGTFVDLRQGGLATSTTTIRRWKSDHQTRHHIIDPASGLPASGRWRTATVWACDTVTANAASTAAIVMHDRSIGWLGEHAPVARLVDTDGNVLRLDGWPETAEAAA